jgi:hypothetical protein
MHDYHPICPTTHLLNYEENFCNLPEKHSCEKCFKTLQSQSRISIKIKSISKWRRDFNDIFNAVDKINIYNISSKNILGAFLDKSDLKKIKLKKINLPHVKNLNRIPVTSYRSKKLNIASIGTITVEKGLYKINNFVDYLILTKKKFSYTIIGQPVTLVNKNINVLGEYDKNNLYNIISDNKINIIFFSSVIPETYSYVLSELFALNLPIVGYDVGAQGIRLRKYKYGTVLPLNSSFGKLYDELQTTYQNRLFY